jgi:hypothetical protein
MQSDFCISRCLYNVNGIERLPMGGAAAADATPCFRLYDTDWHNYERHCSLLACWSSRIVFRQAPRLGWQHDWRSGVSLFFTAILVESIAIFIHPSAEIREIRDFPNGGYIFVMIVCLAQFSLLLAFAVRLVIGLLHLRKDIFAGGANIPDPAPQV